MKSILKKLKKGSADAMAIICLTPVIIILIAAMTSIVQLSILREKLEYTTYNAARAAAISDEKNYKKNAQKLAEIDMLSDQSIYNYIDGSFYGGRGVKVDVSIIQGDPLKETRALGAKNTSSWKKGNLLKCTVTVKAKPALNIFKGKAAQKSFSVVMAIEKPDQVEL